MREFARIVLAAALTASAASAQTFKPFSDVSNCPACLKDRFDNVKLKNSNVIYANVVAENPLFYVLERFGERRAVARDDVSNIKRNVTQSDESRAQNRDQVLLLDGIVLSGILGDGQSSEYYRMVMAPGAFTYEIPKNTIALIFVSGVEKYRSPAFRPHPSS
jgi:hypothetical protein